MKKDGLSPKLIVQTALELAQTEGVDKLSFRKLAKQLNVSAMAIYRHFDNKDDLLAACLDAFIQQADVLPTEDELSWQDWISYVAQKMYKALQAQPSWLPLLGQLALQQHGLAVLNGCLKKLQAEGFSQEAAVRAFFSLLQVLFGACLTEQQMQASLLKPQAFSAQDDEMTSDEEKQSFSHIQNALPSLFKVMQQPQIDLALALLINGLEQELAA